LSVSRKYYLVKQGKTWSEAQAYCQTEHTDLATIQSDNDLAQLQNEAQTQKFNSSAWIGLYNDIDSWRWSYGNEPLRSLTFWYPGQPNNLYGNQECAVSDMDGWNDRDCTEEYPFVCFDGSKNGTDRYIYISNEMAWHDAQAYCRKYYTDLASDRDEIENSIILGLQSYSTWIGLFRESWKWTDKKTFSTINWMSGEPYIYLKDENCGYINNNEAANGLCSDIMPFFCYSG
ncbi:secretory phospholipase A2 receptor-like isoform X1, partial [Silurus meridionalis]